MGATAEMTIVLQEMTMPGAHAEAARVAVNPEKATGFAPDAKTRILHGVTSAIVARNLKTMLVALREAAEAHRQADVVGVVVVMAVSRQKTQLLRKYFQ